MKILRWTVVKFFKSYTHVSARKRSWGMATKRGERWKSPNAHDCMAYRDWQTGGHFYGAAEINCPENKQFPQITRFTHNWIYTVYWKLFHRSGFLSNMRLPWKTQFALKIFAVLNIFFSIQDFWPTLRLPKKTEFAWKVLVYYSKYMFCHE